MANKQPLLEHEGGSCTDSLEWIESKIHDACCMNETQKVTHFLQDRRNDIKTKKLDQLGSLCVAVDNDNLVIVDGLLGIGCNPNVTYSNNKPALFVALVNGNMSIVSSLLNHGAKVEKTLFFAIQNELSNFVKKILELQVDINKLKSERYSRHTPLHLAIDICNLEIVKLLLKHNANPNRLNDKGDTPLYLAVSKGHIEIVKELLNNGAEVDKRSLGVTPFSNAIITNPFNIPKILLEYGADVDAIIDSPWFEGRTSLQIASYVGRLKNVEFLLEHNANINAVDSIKCTPLHLATLANKTKVVNLLLSSGGNDLNIRNEEGNTALESAIAKNHIKVTKMISFHESF